MRNRADRGGAARRGGGLVLAGCSLPTAGGFVPSGQLAGPLEDVESLDGASIAVGSKNFTEQCCSGRWPSSCSSRPGATTTDLTNIPGIGGRPPGMLDDRIQASGSTPARVDHLPRCTTSRSPTRRSSTSAVRDEDLKKNDPSGSKPAPMNNTYGSRSPRRPTRSTSSTKLSDIKKVPVKERTFCVESELITGPTASRGCCRSTTSPGRPEGVPQATSRRFQTGAIYDATAKGPATSARCSPPTAASWRSPEGARGRSQLLPEVQRLARADQEVAEEYPADRRPDRTGGRQAPPTTFARAERAGRRGRQGGGRRRLGLAGEGRLRHRRVGEAGGLQDPSGRVPVLMPSGLRTRQDHGMTPAPAERVADALIGARLLDPATRDASVP